MVQNVAPLMRQLTAEDIYLLSGLEHGMRFGEWVDRGKLPELADLTPEEVEYRLDRCLKFELIERRTIQYEGYRLRFEGYDALALHTLAERDTLTDVGAPLGVGKESDVLEVRGAGIHALKFHREGITNFREVSREREYTADREHISWLYTARKAAEREYDVLQTLYPEVSVPEPLDQNRHAIVMERLTGQELSETRLPEGERRRLLVDILQEVATSYACGFIHADLSEYNVFVTEGGVRLFDWPQAIDVEHPNAPELLRRDLKNIISFFERKYSAEISGIDDMGHVEGLIRQDAIESWINLTN